MAGTVDLDLAGPFATLTLNHPEKRNALDLGMWRALATHFGDLAKVSAVRCIVLRGAGDAAFAAGGDLEEFCIQRATLTQAQAYHAQVGAALKAIADAPQPVVAWIQGACIGGGLEIAGACDLRICGASARFGAPVGRLGFPMYPGELYGLLDLLGPAVMKEILLEGRVFTADEAFAKGLVNRVVADSELAAEVAGTVDRVLAGSPRVAAAHKAWIRRLQRGRPLDAAEAVAAFEFLDWADYREGLAAFLEKRPPRFPGV